MKSFYLVVILSSAFVFTACGTGPRPPEEDIPEQGDGHQYDPNTLDKVRTGRITGKFVGNYTGGLEDGKKGVVPAVLSGDTINTIIVNGKSITLIPEGMNVNGFYRSKDQSGYRVIGANLMYARYGYLEGGADDPVYIFAQGIGSDDIPDDGSATYQGRAFYANRNGFDTTGDAVFNVDFYKKNLTGSISGEGFDPVYLSAQIKGNTFQGKNRNFTTQGTFFGPNAAELSGTYLNDEKSVGGAFGASKK